MKIIITGATGFVGMNLVQYLQEQGHNVQKISLRNKSYTIDSNADVLINLVGKAHDHKGEATEEDFYYANVELIKDLFQKFKNSEIKNFIHISSIASVEEFYSDSPLTENTDCNPDSWYGKSKREAEKWLMEQNESLSSDKKVIILRPPMIHGRGDKGNLRKLYNFISKGLPYPLSSFDNKRSFISIDNFNYFINEIIKSKKLDTSIYHTADDEPIGTKDIVNIIYRVNNQNKSIIKFPKSIIEIIAKIGDYLPIPMNSIRLKKMTSDLVVSNQKIKTALGIEKLPLTAEEGLIKTIKSFKE